MKTAIAVLLAVSLLALAGCGRSPETMSTEQNARPETHTPAPAGEEQSSVAAADPSAATQAEITKEAAQSIALEHAGVTADMVDRLHTEYDRDRINHFEVSFHYNGYEYDYDIHAETGEILDLERELDD